MMKCDFKNEAEHGVLKLYEEITSDNGIDFWTGEEVTRTTDTVQKILDELNGKPLDIHINSYGGEVFEGFAVYNMLKDYAGHKTVYIDGIAASIASVIAMAGDQVIMNKASMMMIHNASGSCWGNAMEMEKVVSALKQIDEVIKDVYLARGLKIGKVTLTKLMEDETYMTAQEAVEYGFADSIMENEKETETYEDVVKSLKQIKNRMQKTLNTFEAIDQLGLEGQSQTGSTPVRDEEEPLKHKFSHWDWLKKEVN